MREREGEGKERRGKANKTLPVQSSLLGYTAV
jgi:hypothetical protein